MVSVKVLGEARPDPRAAGGARPLRLGVVCYLNVEPLVFGLEAEERFRLHRDVPARVGESLHRGEVDLGMIPSIEYAFGDYAIVPGLAIGSRGPIRSVNLFHRGPLDSVQRVALDTSSRTGVALVKVLLHERLGRDPEYLPLPPSVPEMLAAADAALVIGDPALDFEGDAERLDLGEEWRARTGLPFVFAFWAGPPGVVAPADVARLQRALEDGRRNIAAIAARYNAGAAADRNESYLRTNVVFSLGEEEQAGLREFYRRAHALRLIPRVPELRFHGQA